MVALWISERCLAHQVCRHNLSFTGFAHFHVPLTIAHFHNFMLICFRSKTWACVLLFLLQILLQCERCSEKLLRFSQSQNSLISGQSKSYAFESDPEPKSGINHWKPLLKCTAPSFNTQIEIRLKLHLAQFSNGIEALEFGCLQMDKFLYLTDFEKAANNINFKAQRLELDIKTDSIERFDCCTTERLAPFKRTVPIYEISKNHAAPVRANYFT